MANQEHLDILKQGIDTWNRWRQQHSEIQVDLSGADLSDANLRNADLSGADLSDANLQRATIHSANFSGANLHSADLSDASSQESYFGNADFSGADLSDATLHNTDLSKANLNNADLSGADLSEAYLELAILSNADLSGAILDGAFLYNTDFSGADLSNVSITETDIFSVNFSSANLSNADLSSAELRDVDLSGANLSNVKFETARLEGIILSGANLSNAVMGYTTFENIDLREAVGLEMVDHVNPSTIGIDTVYRSGGNIPEIFLRKAGIPDSFIDYMRSLVGKPIDYYSCFISYSSKDEAFVKRLYADLQSNNVRCWFAPEDLRWGTRIRTGIDEAIRLHDKLLLILSKHSVASGWVEHEVKTALARERKEKRTVLFPVRLDKAVLDSPLSWATEICHERNIGDFTRWKDHDAYEKAFKRLLRDLKEEA